MFHFIPSWYGGSRPWYDNTYQWYRKPAGMNFDDIINHLKMFNAAQKQTSVLIPNYMPNLRCFLHRYDLLETDYQSVFDDIQGVSDKDLQKHIDFRQLAWPQNVHFIYTSFLVVARVAGKRLAHIEFGEEGNLVWIDYFKEEIIDKRYVFDDRGFLSSVLYFEGGQEDHQDYLNLAGEWIIREYLTDARHLVEVNPRFKHRFQKLEYASMEDLIAEKFASYFEHCVSAEDTVLVAFHPNHNALLAPYMNTATIVFSLFSQRNNLEQIQSFQDLLNQANLLIADQLALSQQIAERSTTKVEHVSPFDTRLALGKSQHVKELTVYFVLDGLSQAEILGLLDDLVSLMLENDLIHLALVTYEMDFGKRQVLEQFINDWVEAREEGFIKFEDPEDVSFEILGEDEEEASRISFAFLQSEIAIIHQLEYSRLILDLSKTPDLYTQIAGISSGIPQINSVATEFVEHQKNGYILSDRAELAEAINYYFTGLAHWNQSLVYAVQKINAYTKGHLVERIIKNSKRES